MAGIKYRWNFKSGYAKISFACNAIFNFLLSLILIILSLPFFLFIFIMIKLQDGGNVFYKGVRLGLNKKPFMMYKFRTLVPDAEKIIGSELLSSKHKLMTKSGKFLRDTRLDELPQLFNILKGDMDFLGPRPERPAIYEKLCKNIKGYDKRFSVKPGLIGYSQLFTPHSSPKKIRTLIDNKLVEIKQNFILEIIIVVYTIFITVKSVFQKMVKHTWNDLLKSKLLGMYHEQRLYERVKPKEVKIYIGSKIEDKKLFIDESRLIDINEEAFLIYSNCNMSLKQDDLLFKIKIEIQNKGKSKTKTALCYGKIYKRCEMLNNQYKYSYVVMYTPISPFNCYIVHQYLLSMSMI